MHGLIELEFLHCLVIIVPIPASILLAKKKPLNLFINIYLIYLQGQLNSAFVRFIEKKIYHNSFNIHL